MIKLESSDESVQIICDGEVFRQDILKMVQHVGKPYAAALLVFTCLFAVSKLQVRWTMLEPWQIGVLAAWLIVQLAFTTHNVLSRVPRERCVYRFDKATNRITKNAEPRYKLYDIRYARLDWTLATTGGLRYRISLTKRNGQIDPIIESSALPMIAYRRFSEMPLAFPKVGLENIGIWQPIANPKQLRGDCGLEFDAAVFAINDLITNPRRSRSTDPV